MPPTESRSRDEWLAEARRRGERIRRRRRITAALVGAMALVLPVTALTATLGGEGRRGVELTAAGPAPTGQTTTVPDSPVVEPGVAPAAETTSLPAAGGGSAAAGGRESPTTSAEVHGRVASINGSPTPPTTSAPRGTPTTASTTSVPPADDPVVRPPAATTATTGRSGSVATADTTIPPAEPVVVCAVADIKLTVSTDKDAYRPGETVEGTSTLENRSARPCQVPTWIAAQILNSAGEDVLGESSSWGYAGDPRTPDPVGTLVKAEPGTIFTSTVHWKARHCSVPPSPLSIGSECAGTFPAGSYTVVVRWGGTGPGFSATGYTNFQLSG